MTGLAFPVFSFKIFPVWFIIYVYSPPAIHFFFKLAHDISPYCQAYTHTKTAFFPLTHSLTLSSAIHYYLRTRCKNAHKTQDCAHTKEDHHHTMLIFVPILHENIPATRIN